MKKNCWLLLVVGILLIALTTTGCRGRGEITGPSNGNNEEPGTAATFGIGQFKQNGRIMEINPHDTTMQIRWTGNNFVWGRLDTAGYNIITMRWYQIALRNSFGPIDSIWLFSVPRSELHLLRSYRNDPGGAYWWFKESPDGRIIDYDTTNVRMFLLQTWFGLAQNSDRSTGSWNNWAIDNNLRFFPITSNAINVGFVADSGGFFQTDTLMYYKVYNLNHVAMDSGKFRLMFPDPANNGNWYPCVAVNDSGHAYAPTGSLPMVGNFHIGG